MEFTTAQKDLIRQVLDNKEMFEEILRKETEKERIEDENLYKRFVKSQDVKIGESVSFAGITWSKFKCDMWDSCSYFLADALYCNMEFGNTNDWRKSPIRRKLNTELTELIKKDLGKYSLKTFSVDLFSHDGLKDYERCEDEVSILTYDLYRRNRNAIKLIDDWYWLATPDSTPSGCGADGVRGVSSRGAIDYGWCGNVDAVRPFCVIKPDIRLVRNIK